MTIWVPVAATYRTIAQHLLPTERLDLARSASTAITELLNKDDPGTLSQDAAPWSGFGAALCAFAMTAWEELRRGEHTAEAVDAIRLIAEDQQRGLARRGHRWERPEWWGTDDVHSSHRTRLVERCSEYAAIFPATPLVPQLRG